MAPRTINPLSWWQDHESEIPHLANLARKYFAIPASSVTSERAFKVAKFASKYRFRLKAAGLERILFLSYNLEALGHPLLHEMKTPPPYFQKPNGPLKFTHFQSDNAPDDGTSDQVDTRIQRCRNRGGWGYISPPIIGPHPPQ